MDSVNPLSASTTPRYPATPRNTAPGDDTATRGVAPANGAAAPAPQQPGAATTVTLSRRAQELAARQAADEAREASETSQAQQGREVAEVAEAAQQTRRTQAADAADQAAQQAADASSPRAQADAQLRRAYAGAEGSYAR
ncbi:hypothetical protein [Paracidovorax sp. MALMAid1276]|uniref:hypothetical protein n=1 Tax=Paracidovorax sp. MALMAid1276 TaxID=3411631 RepID=UPI003B9D8F08